MMRSSYCDSSQRHQFLARVGKGLYPLVSTVQRHATEAIWLTGSTLRNRLAELPAGAGDIDFVFFNDRETSKSYEKKIESELAFETGITAISVKNQARITPQVEGYRCRDIFQSIDSFPDVTVALAARVFDFDRKTLLFYIPYGLSCFREQIIFPTPNYLLRHSATAYYSWVERKRYERKMPHWQIAASAQRSAARNTCYLVSCR